MKILVIGSGGREHALIRALLRSPSVESVVCIPGNAGIAAEVECIDLFANRDIAKYCRDNAINLVVVGPEQPLVSGLADVLKEENIPVFGPGAKGAQLEASKDFTKQLCSKYNIPTADYATFDKRADALAYVKSKGAPIVIKADGLAAGKGVTVAANVKDALQAVEDCFDGVFGEAGTKVVIEECMVGEEVSFFALCDGRQAYPFASAQDHKRAYDDDKGPNTGGMGSFSPTPLVTPEMSATIMRDIINPTMRGLYEEGIEYIGVLFAGLMMTKTGPKLIEYNCRFGDPETQSILARYTGDLALLLLGCARSKLDEKQIQFSEEAAVCVVMAAKGYPGNYVKGTLIRNLERAADNLKTSIFHAGTMRPAENWLANGGRVLNVVATGGSLRQARYRAYEAIEMIDWPEGFFRKDIGAKSGGKA